MIKGTAKQAASILRTLASVSKDATDAGAEILDTGANLAVTGVHAATGIARGTVNLPAHFLEYIADRVDPEVSDEEEDE